MLTTVILFFIGLFECATLYFTGRSGQKLEKIGARERELARTAPAGGWPTLALIIPVGKILPQTEKALRSLLEQDYPDFMPIIVTEGAEDEASGAIRHLQAEFPGLRHVTAGEARNCGQKNHNLLAAVADCGDYPDVYVFCDSTHFARPDFLRCLVNPIARGEAGIATGYHIVLPRDNSIVTLAYAQTVLLMRFLQGNASLTQPWGGALAISRNAFVRHNVRALWECSVVDDCSLAALLKKEGARVKLAAGALLETYAQAHSLSVWRAWLKRQVLFLKFCMVGQWLALGFFAALVAAPPLWCACACMDGLLDIGAGTAQFLALCWLCIIAWVMNGWRRFLPSPPAPGRWLWAFFCASFMFALVWLGTLFSHGILWQNCLYRVGKGGKVLSIRRK